MTNGDAQASPRPIFVLGLQRSGTTWLANLLSAHPQIVAVEAEDHFGVHESIFFSHFARAYGDLESDENFARFCRDFSASDYALLAGIDPRDLALHRPRSYPKAFRWVMETLVERRGGARYWLEKSPDHTWLAPRLASQFPDALFVAIIRQTLDTVRSRYFVQPSLPATRMGRSRELIRLTASTVLARRWLQRFCRHQKRAYLVSYESLLVDPRQVIEEVLAFLSLDFESGMLRQRYRRNSSFADRGQQQRALSAFDHFLVRSAQGLFLAMPSGILLASRERARRRRGLEWPSWCWKRRDSAHAGQP